MAGSKVIISLTEDQQKQILDATGKRIGALNLDPSQLTQKDLDQVVGGAVDAFIWFEHSDGAPVGETED